MCCGVAFVVLNANACLTVTATADIICEWSLSTGGPDLPEDKKMGSAKTLQIGGGGGTVCVDAVDGNENCPNWADLGYCTQTYVDFMRTNCKKSCNVC